MQSAWIVRETHLVVSNQQRNARRLTDDLQSNWVREDSDVVDHGLELGPSSNEDLLEVEGIDLAETVELAGTGRAREVLGEDVELLAEGPHRLGGLSGSVSTNRRLSYFLRTYYRNFA